MNKKIKLGIVRILVLILLIVAFVPVVQETAYSACVENVMGGEKLPNYFLYKVEVKLYNSIEVHCFVTYLGVTWEIKRVMPVIEGPGFIPPSP